MVEQQVDYFYYYGLGCMALFQGAGTSCKDEGRQKIRQVIQQ